MTLAMPAPMPKTGLLGDTPRRDYTEKLRLFNAFARPELREAIEALSLPPEPRVLDAGCGTGEAVGWWDESLQGRGMLVGMDLATAHARAARGSAPTSASIVQGDMLDAPFTDGTFDLVWTVNTLNHLHDPVAGVRMLAGLLRPGGRIAIGQSSLVPDMYFAWDARLEARVNEAVRTYYRDRYGRSEREFTTVRSIVGWLQRTGLQDVSVHTRMIERAQPLAEADERYLLECIFRGTWGERLRNYMSPADFAELARLCDPHDTRYALRRPDFHFLQSLTIAIATADQPRPAPSGKRFTTEASRRGTHTCHDDVRLPTG